MEREGGEGLKRHIWKCNSVVVNGIFLHRREMNFPLKTMTGELWTQIGKHSIISKQLSFCSLWTGNLSFYQRTSWSTSQECRKSNYGPVYPINLEEGTFACQQWLSQNLRSKKKSPHSKKRSVITGDDSKHQVSWSHGEPGAAGLTPFPPPPADSPVYPP